MHNFLSFKFSKNYILKKLFLSLFICQWDIYFSLTYFDFDKLMFISFIKFKNNEIYELLVFLKKFLKETNYIT